MKFLHFHKIVLSVLVAAAVLSSCEGNKGESSPVEYIAHAGGIINGSSMTNSLEAIDHAFLSGIRFVELDLMLTADSELVTGHDWELFRQMTDNPVSSEPMTLNDYCRQRICGKYTPVTWQMIDSLLDVHPDLYLVTDKISSPEILEKFLGTYRSRIMVECFLGKDYFRLQELGYYKVFLSVHPPYIKTAKRDKRAGLPVFENYAFWYIGKGFNEITPDYTSAYGTEFAVFTMPDRHSADSLAALDRRIRYVYIDNVEPYLEK